MCHVAIHTSSTMVGRDAELTEIASSLGVRPSRAPHQLSDVLLAGDAGVGKTRLLKALRGLAVDDGWQVFAGHCLDFGDSALPYLPFSEVVGRLATELPDVVAEVTTSHPALVRLQPVRRVMGEGDVVDADSAALDRADLFRAVQAVLEAVAAIKPLLLVIEDAHWADRSTRDMLSFLLARADAGGFAVVASYRSDDLHRRHPLRRQVAEWSRLSGVDRVALSPLPDDAVRALVAELVPGGLPEEELAEIVARAEGNAFFVEELTAAAAEPGVWVPADLADVLLVRLDRLDDAARQVVRTASASGRRVGHDVLAATSGLAAGALEEGLRQAVEMNVLVAERGGYAFRHALLGEAVYDDLLPGERARLHTAYVDALEGGVAAGTAAELARHARLAMNREAAISASVRAGNEAAGVGGPDEAAMHYQQALELLASKDGGELDPVDLGIDLSKLVVNTANALTAAGHAERAVAVIEEQLGTLPDDASDTWRSRLLSAQAHALMMTEIEADPVGLSARALELAPTGESALRARVLSTHARILASYERYEEAEEIAVDALELAERLDLGDLVSDAFTTLGFLKRTGTKDALRTALAEAVERAQQSGAVEAEMRARYLLARNHQDWGELEEAATWFASGAEVASSRGLTWSPYGFDARWQLAWIRFARGEWDDAVALLTPDPGSPPPPIARAMLTALRLHLQQVRGDDVAARAAALRPFWPREGSVAIISAPLEMVAAARRGDPAEVLGVYHDVVAVLGRIWVEWFSARVRLAAVAAGSIADVMPRLSTAERETFAEHADRLHADGHTVLERYTDPTDHWGPEGRAWVKRLDAETLRVRWLAGVDAPEAEVLVETWREAEKLFEDFGHVPELTAVRVTLAGILRATGDTAAARETGDLAREAARALGAQSLLDALTASGAAPAGHEPDADALTALTARELEILRHVAEGRSNGDIAKLLFISPKTVSVHVSNILGKLDASGRTEAAAIARRRGLLD